MPDVLSQSQIDALLSSINSGSAPAASAVPEKRFRKYDFKSPRKFTKDRLKMLNGIFESYSRAINTRLNGLLHTTCEVEVESVEEQRYYEFANALTDSSVLTVAYLHMKEKTEETPVLLYVATPLMLSMMDRLMGGNGTIESDLPDDYAYTDLDLHLYENIMHDLISIMGASWESYINLNFEYGRVEVNPTLIQLIGLDETVVLVDLNIKFSNISGRISICLPGMMLTNIFSAISAENPVRRVSSADDSNQIFEHLRDSSLEIAAVLGKAELQLKDIYNLNVGDVIDLNQPKDGVIYLQISGRQWFDGIMGVSDKKIAVKIQQVYRNAERNGYFDNE